MIMIQARSTSKRFPNKIMETIGRWTLVEWVWHRLQNTGIRRAFVVPYRDPVIQFLKDRGFEYFEGPEEDVLGRYFQALNHYKAEFCIRVTADCPFIQPDKVMAICNVVDHAKKPVDFVSNCIYNQVDGHEAEYISRSLLYRMNEFATDPYDREHVTTWAKKNITVLAMPHDYTANVVGKLSVDTLEDLQRLRKIYEESGV